MHTITEIRHDFKRQLQDENFVIDRTGAKLLEIIGAQFLTVEDYIFGTPNLDYIERELQWYNSQSLNVNDILGKTPPIWVQSADSEGRINSNYGWCIYSDDNFNQYDTVLNELRNNTDSRRAQMIYTRPSIGLDYNNNGKNDYICTNVTNHFIRNNELIYIVYMRSNDAIFGYMNDIAWHYHVFNRLYIDLKRSHPDLIKQDHIIWNAASLQVYERHFNLVK